MGEREQLDTHRCRLTHDKLLVGVGRVALP
jgi:hypothetical protein